MQQLREQLQPQRFGRRDGVFDIDAHVAYISGRDTIELRVADRRASRKLAEHAIDAGAVQRIPRHHLSLFNVLFDSCNRKRTQLAKIDLERRRVQRGNRRIGLTATEFEILRHLASRPGRVFTRRELLELLRDYEALDQDEKTINVHVSHLREKIEDDPATPAFVLTVRGVGYAFAER